MKKRYPETLFRKILLPVVHGYDNLSALRATQAIAGEGQILVVGIAYIPQAESLSTAAIPARHLRKTLQELANQRNIRPFEHICVSHTPWDDLCQLIKEQDPDLLVLEWPGQFVALHISPTDVLDHPPCDLVIVGGSVLEEPQNVLVPIRGGPYAELALRISLSIAHARKAQVTSLHLTSPTSSKRGDAPFRGIELVLSNLPEIIKEEIQTNDPVAAILERARQFDLVVMGASGRPEHASAVIGSMADVILRDCQCGVLVVKTKRPMPANMESEAVGQTAISVLVDKWFAENTYYSEEFEDLDYLLALKAKQQVTISLALPALNEEETVGNVIQTIKSALMDEKPLLDEIVLVDSDSLDRTREIAEGYGVPVHIHQQIFPELGARCGKGEALWKSLHVTRGDIILWIDTDIVNIHPRFVYGLIGPLLLRPGIQFVKGFYRRPLKVGDKLQVGGGGRVTELTARPLLNLFYPETSGVIQPLSGEYGGRRAALEQLPFFSGYGVEIGLLIDVLEKFGLYSIAQTDLQERIHHNQSLESLSKMSFAIIQAVIRKLERRYGRSVLEEVNNTMKLIRYEPGRFYLDVEEITERERPPMIDVPDYRKKGAL